MRTMKRGLAILALYSLLSGCTGRQALGGTMLVAGPVMLTYGAMLAQGARGDSAEAAVHLCTPGILVTFGGAAILNSEYEQKKMLPDLQEQNRCVVPGPNVSDAPIQILLAPSGCILECRF